MSYGKYQQQKYEVKFSCGHQNAIESPGVQDPSGTVFELYETGRGIFDGGVLKVDSKCFNCFFASNSMYNF